MLNDKNVLSVISSNNLIFHGINDKEKRKLMTFDAAYGNIVSHYWCHNRIILAFGNGHIIALDASSYCNQHFECSEMIRDMHAIHLQDFGCIVAVIDGECIRFLKLMHKEREWEQLNAIKYANPQWIEADGIPNKIQLTQNGTHSVIVTDNGTMIIHNLMM